MMKIGSWFLPLPRIWRGDIREPHEVVNADPIVFCEFDDNIQREARCADLILGIRVLTDMQQFCDLRLCQSAVGAHISNSSES